MFTDRSEAGRRLAERLGRFKGEAPVVLALPRGGVVVAVEAARALGAPLDIVVSRKIAAPDDPELAIGAVVEGDAPGDAVLNEGVLGIRGVTPEYLHAEVQRQLQEIRRRQERYRGGRPPVPLAGRTVILVDDGVATGASMLAAVRGVRRRKASRVVVAVPVSAADAAEAISATADEFVCLEQPEPFLSVGTHFLSFGQTEDEEVVSLLQSASAKK